MQMKEIRKEYIYIYFFLNLDALQLICFFTRLTIRFEIKNFKTKEV